MVHGERSGYPGFETRPEGRTWSLRKTGGDYYGDGEWRGQEAGPRGRSWENRPRFTGLDENTSSNGCFPSGFPLTLVPSPFHSFRRSLDASFMLMSALGTGATEAWRWASDKPGTIFVFVTLPPPHASGDSDKSTMWFDPPELL